MTHQPVSSKRAIALLHHDLQHLLRSAYGDLQRLPLSGPGLSDDQTKLVERATERLRDISQMVERAALWQVGPSLRPVELADLLRTLEAEIVDARRSASVRGSGLFVKWETASVPDRVVLSDAKALGVALSGLLDNALRYASSERESTVSVVATVEGEVLVVAVADQGPGVDPEDREVIFELGHRGRRDRGMRSHGRGDGLPLARALVQGLGGTLTMVERSELIDRPAGTVFEIRVPLRAGEA